MNVDPTQNETYQALLAQGYGPAEIEQIMQLGAIPEQQQQIQDKRDFYDQHREADIGRGIHTGRTYVASSPLKMVGELGKQYIAQKKLEGLDEEGNKLANEQVQKRLQFLRGGRGAPPAPGMGNPGMANALRGGAPQGGPPRFSGRGTYGV